MKQTQFVDPSPPPYKMEEEEEEDEGNNFCNNRKTEKLHQKERIEQFQREEQMKQSIQYKNNNNGCGSYDDERGIIDVSEVMAFPKNSTSSSLSSISLSLPASPEVSSTSMAASPTAKMSMDETTQTMLQPQAIDVSMNAVAMTSTTDDAVNFSSMMVDKEDEEDVFYLPEGLLDASEHTGMNTVHNEQQEEDDEDALLIEECFQAVGKEDEEEEDERPPTPPPYPPGLGDYHVGLPTNENNDVYYSPHSFSSPLLSPHNAAPTNNYAIPTTVSQMQQRREMKSNNTTLHNALRFPLGDTAASTADAQEGATKNRPVLKLRKEISSSGEPFSHSFVAGNNIYQLPPPPPPPPLVTPPPTPLATPPPPGFESLSMLMQRPERPREAEDQNQKTLTHKHIDAGKMYNAKTATDTRILHHDQNKNDKKQKVLPNKNGFRKEKGAPQVSRSKQGHQHCHQPSEQHYSPNLTKHHRGKTNHTQTHQHNHQQPHCQSKTTAKSKPNTSIALTKDTCNKNKGNGEWIHVKMSSTKNINSKNDTKEKNEDKIINEWGKRHQSIGKHSIAIRKKQTSLPTPKSTPPYSVSRKAAASSSPKASNSSSPSFHGRKRSLLVSNEKRQQQQAKPADVVDITSKPNDIASPKRKKEREGMKKTQHPSHPLSTSSSSPSSFNNVMRKATNVNKEALSSNSGNSGDSSCTKVETIPSKLQTSTTTKTSSLHTSIANAAPNNDSMNIKSKDSAATATTTTTDKNVCSNVYSTSTKKSNSICQTTKKQQKESNDRWWASWFHKNSLSRYFQKLFLRNLYHDYTNRCSSFFTSMYMSLSSSLPPLLHQFYRWFFKLCNKIRVLSVEYIFLSMIMPFLVHGTKYLLLFLTYTASFLSSATTFIILMHELALAEILGRWGLIGQVRSSKRKKKDGFFIVGFVVFYPEIIEILWNEFMMDSETKDPLPLWIPQYLWYGCLILLLQPRDEGQTIPLPPSLSSPVPTNICQEQKGKKKKNSKRFGKEKMKDKGIAYGRGEIPKSQEKRAENITEQDFLHLFQLERKRMREKIIRCIFLFLYLVSELIFGYWLTRVTDDNIPQEEQDDSNIVSTCLVMNMTRLQRMMLGFIISVLKMGYAYSLVIWLSFFVLIVIGVMDGRLWTGESLLVSHFVFVTIFATLYFAGHMEEVDE